MRLKHMIRLTFTKDQHKDAGMAFVLILVIIGIFTGNAFWFKALVPAVLLTMIIPVVFYPFSVIWYGLADLLGSVMSKVVLGLIYFIIVLPTGLIRRLAGKDVLNLKDFKKGQQSMFKTRNTSFTHDDISNPY